MTVRMKVDTDALASYARRLGDRWPAVVARIVLRIILQAQREIVQQIRPGGALTPRSGQLAKSWRAAKPDVKSRGRDAGASLGSEHPASAIHEFGGEVAPVNASMLAIPLGPAKTAAGAARYLSPREVPDLWLLRSRAGNKLLVKRIGGGRFAKGGGREAARIEPWFLLRERVTIPARHYLSLAMRETEAKASGIASEVVVEALEAA